jgi:hypothetical protein
MSENSEKSSDDDDRIRSLLSERTHLENEIKERSHSPNKYNLDDEVKKETSASRFNDLEFRLNLIEATSPCGYN